MYKIYFICTGAGTVIGGILAAAANLTREAGPELVQLGHYGGALMLMSLAAFVLGVIVYTIEEL